MLLIATTTGYQTRMFEEAAERLGVGSSSPPIAAITSTTPGATARFQCDSTTRRDPGGIVAALSERPVDGILAVGDRPVVMAAALQRRLGLPGHPAAPAAIARDKRRLRVNCATQGFPFPSSRRERGG